MADPSERLGHWLLQWYEGWQILKREIEMVPVPCPPAPLFDCAVCQVARAGPLQFWEVAWCGCPAAPQKPEDKKGGRRVVIRSSRPSQCHCLHNSCLGASFERHKLFNIAFPFPKGCLLCLWKVEFLSGKKESEHPFFLKWTPISETNTHFWSEHPFFFETNYWQLCRPFLLLLFSFHFHVQNNYVLWSWFELDICHWSKKGTIPSI